MPDGYNTLIDHVTKSTYYDPPGFEPSPSSGFEPSPPDLSAGGPQTHSTT